MADRELMSQDRAQRFLAPFRLEPRERLALFCYLTSPATYEEIGRMLGCTTNAIATAVKKARSKIKAEIDQARDDSIPEGRLPAWAFADARVLLECLSPVCCNPVNALAGQKEGETAHIGQGAAGARRLTSDDFAEVIFQNEMRRQQRGLEQIPWAPTLADYEEAARGTGSRITLPSQIDRLGRVDTGEN